MLLKNRKIGANLVFTMEGEPIRNGVIEINSEGIIINSPTHNSSIPHIAALEYYPGILTPGFIFGDINNKSTIELSSINAKTNNHFLKFWNTGIQLLGTFSDYDNEPFEILKESDNFFNTLNSITKDKCINTNYLKKYGSIKEGKQPGIISITGFDFKNNKLSNSATIKRIY